MKSNRLFEILLILVNKRKVTSVELAEEFEVSVRTIYRDIETLSSSGIPVYTKNGKNGGIYLMDNYTLDKTMVSNHEKEDILFALKALGSVPNLKESEVLKKVEAVFDKDSIVTNGEWLEIDFSPWKSLTSKESKLFSKLKESINKNKSIRIQYVSTRLEESSRSIDPIKLVFKHKDWYLIGYCRVKVGFRMFKINRIISCEILEEDAQLYLNIPKMYNNDYMDDKALMNVEIFFSMSVAYRVYEEFDREQISRVDDSKIRLKGDVEVNDWFISKLLSYGGDIYIKSPKDLKDKVINKHKEAIKKLSV